VRRILMGVEIKCDEDIIIGDIIYKEVYGCLEKKHLNQLNINKLSLIAGFSHQPPSYFQSNLRKVSLTSNMSNSSPYANFNAYHHNILRLPTLQSTPNSIAQFYNQKISKTNSSDSKVQQNSNGTSNVKRKRSWSRAVFSNLQRKGLERQFEFQKYITKPDRKKLAARLGLKDAQVKVWFQVIFIALWYLMVWLVTYSFLRIVA
jgi:Homeodomain